MNAINRLMEFAFEADLEELSDEKLTKEIEEYGVDVHQLMSTVQQSISESLANKTTDKTGNSYSKQNSGGSYYSISLSNKPWMDRSNKGVVLSVTPSTEVAKSIFCEINLADFFSTEEIERSLSWAGGTLQITRNIIEGNENKAVYTAYMDVRNRISKRSFGLRLNLRTLDDKQATALLSADVPNAVISGDILPKEWNTISLELFIEKEV